MTLTISQIQKRPFPGKVATVLAFAFTGDNNGSETEAVEMFHIIRCLTILSTSDLIRSLQPSAPYQRPRRVVVVTGEDCGTIDGDPPPA